MRLNVENVNDSGTYFSEPTEKASKFSLSLYLHRDIMVPLTSLANGFSPGSEHLISRVDYEK